MSNEQSSRPEAPRDASDTTVERDNLRALFAQVETEERWRLALAAADLGTWDWEAGTGTLTCDARLRVLCGIPDEDRPGLNGFLEAAHPDDVDRVRLAVDHAFDPASGGHYALEYRTVCPSPQQGTPGRSDISEEVRWISVRGRTFFDAQGRAVRFCGAALDTTLQRRARDEVERADRRARLIADSLPQIAWLADGEGRAVFYNRRWYDYTGVPPGSLDPADWTRAVHPDDLAELLAGLARSQLERRAWEAELRLRRADGSHRWHLARSLPLLDDAGNVSGWVGSSTDIHDRRREEDGARLLAEAGNLLSASLDTAQSLRQLVDLLVPTLADGCILHLVDEAGAPRAHYIAHATATGRAAGEALAHRYPAVTTAGPFAGAGATHTELHVEIDDDLLIGWARDATHLALLRALEPCAALTVPIVIRGRGLGSLSLVTSDCRRLGPEDLTVARGVAERAAHAIENSRLYQEAQDAVRVRDDFMSIASHELKTPLTPLQLQLQSLQAQTRDILPERVTRKLDVIGRQVNRLERLVGSLLEISRLTGRTFEVECEEVELTGVAREVAQRFRLELEHARCPFVLDAPEPVSGHWDEMRVDQIISNLLSNALKFGPGRPIELRITAADGMATITVQDHGIGIGEADQARIFERFEKAVPSRHYGGFGLGLWIVRQIVSALGGTIEVKSALGEGSLFTVRLPQQRLVPTETPPREPRVH